MEILENLCMGCMQLKTGSLCAHCGWLEGTPPTSPVFLPPRTVLDKRYLLGRVLGAGGFGITYLAWDLNLDLKLAIKEYFPNAYGVRDRDHCTVVPSNTQSTEAFEHGLTKFLAEGRALARFQGHPSIASVMSFFRENGTSYLVMKYEDGITLEQFLRQHGGRMDFDAVVRTAMPIMDALRAVHEEGILHRDISPDNIIITRTRQIKILDFGSAKRDMTSQDRTLQITLKPGFSPEEQYRTNGKQGPWTDVYAVGATLYMCLSGSKPPDALERLDNDTLQPPSQLGVNIPKDCEKALMKALAVRAAGRFQTMEEFQKEFVSHVPGPSPSKDVRPSQGPILAGLRDWVQPRRRLLAWASGAALALFALILLLPILLAVPTIQQFAVDPSNVPPGQPVTVSWAASGGKISISPDIGKITQNSGSRQIRPSTKTTYTLTVSGLVRSVTRSATVAVAAQAQGQPLAITFTADPPTTKPGAPVDLVWSVTGNPASVAIDQGVGTVKSSDRIRVSPTADTTYALTAQGPDGATSTASVTVSMEVPVPKPVIVSLTAEPPAIRKGQSALLTWKVTGDNTQASLDQNIGKVKLQDSLSVSPELSTTYKLLARNAGGNISKSVTVQVAQPEPPKIDAFSAAPANIPYGGSASLSWSVTGEVTSVSVAPDIGTVAAAGSRKVSPPGTTRYTITATGPGGTSSLEFTLQVSAPKAPSILTFTANPTIVGPKELVTLQWKVDGEADAVTLDPGAPRLPKEGSFGATPQQTVRYTLIVHGPGGTKSKTVDVYVSKAPFEIAVFEVKPKNQKIKRGKTATLSWIVTGPPLTGLSIDPPVAGLPVANTGSIEVTPDVDTTYILTARIGDNVRKQTVIIKVSK